MYVVLSRLVRYAVDIPVTVTPGDGRDERTYGGRPSTVTINGWQVTSAQARLRRWMTTTTTDHETFTGGAGGAAGLAQDGQSVVDAGDDPGTATPPALQISGASEGARERRDLQPGNDNPPAATDSGQEGRQPLTPVDEEPPQQQGSDAPTDEPDPEPEPEPEPLEEPDPEPDPEPVDEPEPSPDAVQGTGGNDWLYGDDEDDEIHGLGGHDLLNGRRGHDRLYGGEGADNLYGEDGDDRLYGGAGRGTCSSAGNGDDDLSGGAGRRPLHVLPPATRATRSSPTSTPTTAT